MLRNFLYLAGLWAMAVSAMAAGNHPEAGMCPPEKPYHAICTHSLHSLEGWYGKECHAMRDAAEQDAKAHAEKMHEGNMRWTGVYKTR